MTACGSAFAIAMFRDTWPSSQEGAATVITCDFPSASKTAAARLIGTDGAQEINLAKGRPQHIRKVELTMHALPKEET